jgi:glycosyltransferase involved in cell wall biosynthesis
MNKVALSFTCNFRNLQDGISKYTSIIKNNVSNKFEIIPYTFKIANKSIKAKINFTFPYTFFAIKNFLFNSKIIFKDKIDLIHVTDNRFIFKNHTPVLTTIHDVIPIEFSNWNRSILQKNIIFKKIYLKGILSSDRIISISNYTKNKLIKLGYDEKKIDVIHHGIDKNNFFKIIKKNKSIDEIVCNKDIILCVGTIQPRKNIIRYIESFRRLESNIKKNSLLIIVGKKGWSCSKEISTLKLLNKNENIIWFNNLPDKDLNYLYTKSKILLYASLEEGFGLPILDAFVSSTAVITSNISCLPEIAEDAAYYVDPHSIEEITLALKNLLTSNLLLNNIINIGHKRVANFKLENMILKTEDVYKKML